MSLYACVDLCGEKVLLSGPRKPRLKAGCWDYFAPTLFGCSMECLSDTEAKQMGFPTLEPGTTVKVKLCLAKKKL